MRTWRQHQQILLALTFVGVFFTIGKFILDPSAGNRAVTPFAFPSVVPLPGWQILESRPQAEPIASHTHSYEALLANQKYLYQRNDHRLEIEMGYVVGTLGRLHDYLRDDTSDQLQGDRLLQNLRQQKGVGFYSLFVYQGRAHLAACINPHGGSTVTKGQFLINRYTYDFQPQRLVAWLLGKESLLDRRCLWVDLSLSLNQVPAKTTYLVLEQAWYFWYRWWNSRFPQY